MKPVLTVHDPAFARYGVVLKGYDTEPICAAAREIPMPEKGVSYERSIPALERTSSFGEFARRFGGEQPLEAGLCWGSNDRMNAVEYHRSSEVNIAVTDMVLMLGDQRDIQDNRYDAQRLEYFLVEKGTAVELYATTLHFAPCNAAGQAYFCAVIILPEGTNAPLTAETAAWTVSAQGEDRLLFARNKWMIAHAECGDAKNGTAFVGIKGENPICSHG